MAKKFRKVIEPDGTEYYEEVEEGEERDLQGWLKNLGDLFISCGCLLMLLPIIVTFLFIIVVLLFY